MENKQNDNFNLSEEMVLIGARVRSIRNNLKMSQTQFATIAKVSQSKIAQCEIGSILVQSDVLLEIYRALGISPLWILLGEGERTVTKKINNNPTNFEEEVIRSISKMHSLQLKEITRRVKELEIEVLLLKNN